MKNFELCICFIQSEGFIVYFGVMNMLNVLVYCSIYVIGMNE